MGHPQPERVLSSELLRVEVYASRQAMGVAAAHDVGARMRELLANQERVRMVFAAAPSQNEFLAALGEVEDLNWSAVEAFHMDEYIGLPPDAPQRFSLFLRNHLFDRVHPGRIEYIDAYAQDASKECSRYAVLLQERPVDIVCAGIGENGHMAFNDPHVADFQDTQWVKQVTLDRVCRMQQVHDGAFPSLEDVPMTAVTLTMPALMSARWVYCMVPGPAKTQAVSSTLHDPVTPACPATILRRHPQAVLYLDRDAAAGL